MNGWGQQCYEQFAGGSALNCHYGTCTEGALLWSKYNCWVCNWAWNGNTPVFAGPYNICWAYTGSQFSKWVYQWMCD